MSCTYDRLDGVAQTQPALIDEVRTHIKNAWDALWQVPGDQNWLCIRDRILQELATAHRKCNNVLEKARMMRVIASRKSLCNLDFSAVSVTRLSKEFQFV